MTSTKKITAALCILSFMAIITAANTFFYPHLASTSVTIETAANHTGLQEDTTPEIIIPDSKPSAESTKETDTSGIRSSTPTPPPSPNPTPDPLPVPPTPIPPIEPVTSSGGGSASPSPPVLPSRQESVVTMSRTGMDKSHIVIGQGVRSVLEVSK